MRRRLAVRVLSLSLEEILGRDEAASEGIQIAVVL